MPELSNVFRSLLIDGIGDLKTLTQSIQMPANTFVEYRITPPLDEPNEAWLVYAITFGDFPTTEFEVFIQHRTIRRHKIFRLVQLHKEGLDTLLDLTPANPLYLNVKNINASDGFTFEITYWFMVVQIPEIVKITNILRGQNNLLAMAGELNATEIELGLNFIKEFVQLKPKAIVTKMIELMTQNILLADRSLNALLRLAETEATLSESAIDVITRGEEEPPAVFLPRQGEVEALFASDQQSKPSVVGDVDPFPYYPTEEQTTFMDIGDRVRGGAAEQEQISGQNIGSTLAELTSEELKVEEEKAVALQKAAAEERARVEEAEKSAKDRLVESVKELPEEFATAITNLVQKVFQNQDEDEEQEQELEQGGTE